MNNLKDPLWKRCVSCDKFFDCSVRTYHLCRDYTMIPVFQDVINVDLIVTKLESVEARHTDKQEDESNVIKSE